MEVENGIGLDDIKNVVRSLKNKEISATELVVETFLRIKNSGLNAYICLNEHDAFERAKQFDNGLIKGELAGVPIAIKDNFNVQGLPTTCASNALKTAEIASNNALLVQKLLDEGAIITGKTNMDEFAMGSSNMTSAFGKVLNPLNKTRVCGGSSGGSACAVASKLAFGALGSDTGGSIRQPASYCGVVGLKPSINKLDATGMIPLAPSFDQAGIFCRSVDDCRLLFDILSRRGTATFTSKVKGKLTVGIIKDLPIKWAEAGQAQNAVAKEFERAGHNVVDVSIPFFSYAHEVYDIEAYAQMYQSISSLNLNEELLGAEVKKRMRLGQGNLSNPSMIMEAQRIKNELTAQFVNAFNLCDVIITPSAPTTAFGFDEDANSDAVKFSDFFTQPPSVCGLSAISVPFWTGVDGMPLGIQVIGLQEPEVFFAGKVIEKAKY